MLSLWSWYSYLLNNRNLFRYRIILLWYRFSNIPSNLSASPKCCNAILLPVSKARTHHTYDGLQMMMHIRQWHVETTCLLSLLSLLSLQNLLTDCKRKRQSLREVDFPTTDQWSWPSSLSTWRSRTGSSGEDTVFEVDSFPLLQWKASKCKQSRTK